MDVRVDLRDKAMPKGVKKMRDEELGRKGVTRGYGDAGVGRKWSLTAAATGGTLSSFPSGLEALGWSG